MVFRTPGSPTKRSMANGTPGSARTGNGSLSRPQTPQLLRRPASSASMRSPTLTTSSRYRTNTPSWQGGLQPQPASSAASYSGKIKVAVRIKPSSPSSSGSGSDDGPLWDADPDLCTISNRELGQYTFDSVFTGYIPNSSIFDSSVSELVDKVMQGYNATVFAYGMTGSGKTFSMQGMQSDPGIIPLSVQAIFDHIGSASASKTYSVRVSYLEIYNEQLYDLLSPSTPSDDIRLREAPGGAGIKAIGLSELAVDTPGQLLGIIAQGDSIRHTAGTEFNSRSSRSHAVVQIFINSAPLPGKSNLNIRHSSTLYLCDLAGSERAVQASERRKEGSYINKSLLTLGTVISRLSAGAGGHVPYRDSKLTRLLQPALSGQSLVAVLCTIQTLGSAYTETVSTLRFAARARNVTLNVRRNDEIGGSGANAKAVEALMQQVAAQKLEIEQLRAGRDNSQIYQLEAENRILHERVEHLTRLVDDSRLDEVLGIDDDRLSETSSDSRAGASAYSHQIEEYKSYISHLEKQLYQQALSHPRAATPNNSVPASPSLGSQGSSSNHFRELIRDLQEELEELRQSSDDKDRIISALRSINRRKENLASSLSGSASSSTSSFSTIANPHSPAYSRYYFGGGSTISPQSPTFSEADEDTTLTGMDKHPVGLPVEGINI